MNRLGDYLRQKRIEKNLLIRQLSSQLEIDPAYLSKIERGDRTCNKELVMRIAKALNQNKDDLLFLWIVDKLEELDKEEPLTRAAIHYFLDN